MIVKNIIKGTIYSFGVCSLIFLFIHAFIKEQQDIRMLWFFLTVVLILNTAGNLVFEIFRKVKSIWLKRGIMMLLSLAVTYPLMMVFHIIGKTNVVNVLIIFGSMILANGLAYCISDYKIRKQVSAINKKLNQMNEKEGQR